MKDFYAIKVGSILVTKNGGVDKEFILHLCGQVAEIIRNGDYAFIVSSGAIANEPNKEMTDNLRAVIGQVGLMSVYQIFFDVFGFKMGQMLVTDNDLANPRVMQNNLLEASKYNVPIIINENDGTVDKETRRVKYFTDNDELIQNICLLPELQPRLKGVIIGMDKAGVLDTNENKVDTVDSCNFEQVKSYAKGGNALGRGKNGALSKFNVCKKLADNGIPTMLAPGRDNDFVFKAIERIKGNGDYNNYGTLFTPC